MPADPPTTAQILGLGRVKLIIVCEDEEQLEAIAALHEECGMDVALTDAYNLDAELLMTTEYDLRAAGGKLP